MAVSAPTNPSSGDIVGPTVVLNISHTAEAGKAIYVVVCGRCFPLSGSTDFAVSATYGGVALDRWASWFSAARNDIMRFWIFSLRPSLVVAGTDTLTFTSGTPAVIDEYSAIAFNVSGGASNGSVVLPGGYYPFDPVTDLTKTAYGWATGGQQITVTWGRQGSSGISIAEGTQFATASGMVANYLPTADAAYSFTATRAPSGGILGMLSFLIPPDEPMTGGCVQPVLTGIIPITVFAPGYAATSGFPYANFMNGSPFSGRQGNILPFPGTIRSFALRSQLGALGGARTVEATFMRGGYDANSGNEGMLYPSVTSVVVDLIDPAEIVLQDGLDFSFARYEQIGMQLAYTAGTGQISPNFAASFLIECGGPALNNDQVYGGGVMQFSGGALNTPAYTGILHPDGNVWQTFTVFEKSVTGIDVVIEELLVPYQTQTALDPDYQYYLVVDGVLQDGSGGTVNTAATLIPNTMNRAFARSRFSLFVPEHHFVSVAAIQRDGSSATLRHSPIIRVRPATRGAFMLSGRSTYGGGLAQSMSTSANSAGGDWDTGTLAATQAKFAQPFPPVTFVSGGVDLVGIYTDLDGTAPGGATSWTQTLQVNGSASAMPPLVISGSNTTGTTGGTAPVVGGDLVGLIWQGAGFPNAARQFWTIPGFATPPPLGGIIIVEKDAGGDLVTQFPIIAGGGLSPAAFNLVEGTPQTFDPVTPGSGYGFAETPPPNWTQTGVVVSNGSPIGNISVAAGETVTVTFTNAFSPPPECPGDRDGSRTDGLPYSPFNPAPCIGPGVRSGSRTGD